MHFTGRVWLCKTIDHAIHQLCQIFFFNNIYFPGLMIKPTHRNCHASYNLTKSGTTVDCDEEHAASCQSMDVFCYCCWVRGFVAVNEALATFAVTAFRNQSAFQAMASDRCSYYVEPYPNRSIRLIVSVNRWFAHRLRLHRQRMHRRHQSCPVAGRCQWFRSCSCGPHSWSIGSGKYRNWCGSMMDTGFQSWIQLIRYGKFQKLCYHHTHTLGWFAGKSKSQTVPTSIDYDLFRSFRSYRPPNPNGSCSSAPNSCHTNFANSLNMVNVADRMSYVATAA